MRALAVLLLPLLAASTLAEENLLPRAGSGWAGFKAGTTVRVKRTFIGKGRVPAVTITILELKTVGKQNLTIEMKAKNAVGMEHVTKMIVPVTGEAGEGETATTEQFAANQIQAAGKQHNCSCTQTTVTSKQGKRVIVKWTSLQKPFMRIRRTETTTDAAGKTVGSFSMVLAEEASQQTIGTRKVRCLKYTTVRRAGKATTRATAYVSREVPGYEVRVDAEVTVNNERVQTVRVEVLDFKTAK